MTRIVVLIAVCWCLLAASASAQTIHAVLVGDTTDPTIGVGITENLRKMRNFFRQAQTEGELNIVVTEVKDAAFNCPSIVKAVKALPVQADDTVVFYYSGHGFRRVNTQTQFPEFDCRRTQDPDRAELAGVANLVLKPPAGSTTPPRLVIAIADTCNRQIELPEQAVGPAAAGVRPSRKAAFRRLFLQYSGTLMMSGSTPGEFSWYMNSGLQIGGFFTNQLLRAIDSKMATQVADVRWEDIATDASKKIFIPRPEEETTQTPQFAMLNLSAQSAPR
ncbi:caspase family protein [Bradyrhizobium sp. NBAIM01]|uniref:caspase family protein n=1 Tax=Bradyrhizobium sp. NBAIM01 TaxID=2793818 RepID=UPI001CD66FD2|nr:caspase family protein [Bradyrhizobium sp. NBAIM01]MCA1510215.1 caspase family protein [Bradyrhizobium sp. NBAIM01]